jgi:serine/threonine protein kinase
MEYCAGGAISDLMEICERCLTEDQICVVMRMALSGLAYLHECGKIHRDIKAGNILCTSTGACKLADFGVAGELTASLAKKRTVIGTPHWMAPEVLLDDEYNEKADIWSLGVSIPLTLLHYLCR